MKVTPILLVTLALCAVGCHRDDDGEEPEKPPIAFEGQPDARFAATWGTLDKRSTYGLSRDGSYVLDSLIDVKGHSPMKTRSQGEWRVNGDSILFKDAAANVVPYTYELKGDTLTFTSTGTLKNKTVLKKKSGA